MGDINKESVARAYARWAPVYDAVFGKVFAPGRAAAIEAAEAHCGPQGGRILEIGVGTGISLPAYRSVNRITGIAEIHEADTLDHPALFDIKTGNDALGQHVTRRWGCE